MQISQEQLQEIEKLAGLFMTPDKIATILQIPFSTLQKLLQDQSHPVYAAFKRGALMRESDLRKSVLDLADRGSSPAQTLAVKMLEEFRDNLISNSID